MRQLAKSEAEKSKDDSEEEIMSRASEKLEEILSSYEETGHRDELSEKDIDKMLKRLVEDEKKSAERTSRYAHDKSNEKA
jgi:hypothetical protein